VARDVRLRLVEQLRELADGELLFGRQREQAQARGIAEQPVELPAFVAAGVVRIRSAVRDERL
jgi:hypothetical protein